jgi:N-acylneuraminate cytidylyltransferase
MSDGVIAIIPARAGSVRLPGKNMLPLAGKPMIQWTLEAALAARTLDRIVVSSDDEAVLRLADTIGEMTILRRPADLSGPDASSMDVVRHALDHVGGTWAHVVLLQPTSPLRSAADVDGAVALCRAAGAPAVIAVSPLPKPPAFHATLDAAGRLVDVGEPQRLRVINGAVYVGRTDVVTAAGTFRVEGCIGWDMPPERSVDVDTAADFAACASLMTSPGDSVAMEPRSSPET